MRKGILILLLTLFPGLLTHAEVIFLRTGEIVIGTIVAASPGILTVKSFGLNREVPVKDVLKTINSWEELKERTIMVLLKDGTTLIGKPVDVDEELGVFLDIGFGTLALPIPAVSFLADPERRQIFQGKSLNFGALGLVAFPLNSTYGMSYGGAAAVEFRIADLRSLYMDLVILAYPLNYLPNTLVSLLNTNVQLNVVYKVFEFGEVFSALEFLVPYVGLGVGATLVTVFDNRPNATVDQRGLLTFSFQSHLGLEWNLPWKFHLRTGGGVEAILQSGGVFWVPNAQVGLFYGF